MGAGPIPGPSGEGGEQGHVNHCYITFSLFLHFVPHNAPHAIWRDNSSNHSTVAFLKMLLAFALYVCVSKATFIKKKKKKKVFSYIYIP